MNMREQAVGVKIAIVEAIAQRWQSGSLLQKLQPTR